MNVSKLLRVLKKLLAVLAACLMISSVYADASSLTVSISQLDDDKFPDVSAYFSVLGPNGIPVLGLTREQIHIFEDVNFVEDYVMNVVQHTEDPLSLAIVIDRSNSMWLHIMSFAWICEKWHKDYVSKGKPDHCHALY